MSAAVEHVPGPAEGPVEPSLVAADEGGDTGPEAGSSLGRWWRSRLGYRLLVEIWLTATLLFMYKFARYAVREQATAAFRNAREVIRLERVLGIFTELDAQSLALRSTGFVRFLNMYYLSAHFALMAVFLVWLYVRHADGYRHCRRVLVTLTVAGLFLHATFPLAPPRMFANLGFVDTQQVIGPATYRGGVYHGVANQFAAMPSLHFGWAVLIAWGAIIYSSSRWRYLTIAHPVLTLAAIVMTANHYWLDAIVAVILLLAAIAVDPVWPRLRRRSPAAEPDREALATT